MAVLVTGGAGYIGSHMVLALLEAGERAVVLDDLSTGVRANLAAGARLVEGSVADEALVARLIAEERIEAVLHFAGSVVVPDSVADPLGYYENNTIASHRLIRAAVRGGVRHFIFSSTAAVYGAPSAGAAAIGEDAPLAPINPYGASKAMTERMLADAGAAHGLSHACLRYFNVAGADPQGRTGQSTPNATHLIKVAVQAALGHRPRLEIFGTDYDTPDGTCIRDYIHVSDLAEAHLATLAHLRAGGAPAVFNCGYGRGHSVREVIAAVRRVSGLPLEPVEAARRPGDPPALVAEAGRIRAATGWTPRLADLDTIVAHALAWERRLGAGAGAAAS
jgi:UDP-glucose 4-epimerase